MALPFGKARAATEDETQARDLGSDKPWSVSLGRFKRKDSSIGGRLRYGGERNLLVFGPNGSGKGVRLLTPILLQTLDRSIVVIDPKGELAAVTAPFRRTIGDVVVINPFGVLIDQPGYEDLRSDGYNPLPYLDPTSPSFNADASWLAEALVMVEGRDPHWDRSARKLVAALIMHVVLLAHASRKTDKPFAPTLGMVRELLTEPFEQPKEGLPKGSGIPKTANDMIAWGNPALKQKAGQFTRWSREIAAIVSSADTQTEAFDDFEIAADLAKPGIDFRELKKRPITVYVILPPDMMDRHSRWQRLILSAALRGVMRHRQPDEMRTLFLIDEFAALGHLQIIETVWALVRGYGIQIMPILQDLNQLKSLYKERWETFIGMAGATVAFGPNDLTTAEWMSRRAGDNTVPVQSYNQSANLQTGLRGAGGTSEGTGTSLVKVPYLPAHELFDTPEGDLHIWLAGMASTVSAHAPMWVDIEQCAKRGRDNPYYVKE